MSEVSELLSMARRSSVVNHLKNGNFLNIPKQLTPVNNYDNIRGYTKTFRTNYTYLITTQGTSQSTTTQLQVPGFYVSTEPPDEDFIGYWQVWGVAGVVSFNSIDRSFDGGHLVGVEFNEKGTIQFKQSIESFDKFRGKPVSFALSGRKVTGDVKITLKIDTGTKTIESRPFYSRYFGDYYRMVVTLDIGLDITKFDVIISLEGSAQSLVGFSGAMLALGPYRSVLPYADSPSDVALPSGTVILYAGKSCPPGFRSIADDCYLFVTFGDPNAFRGNMASSMNNVLITNEPYIGEPRHDHQSSGTNEVQPAAFDLLGNRFTTNPVDKEQTPENPEVRPVLAYEADINDVYFGLRERTLDITHAHVYNISDEAIEPPRVLFKICEKI